MNSAYIAKLRLIYITTVDRYTLGTPRHVSWQLYHAMIGVWT